MNAKQALLTSAAVCMICLACLLAQSVFTELANATSLDSAEKGDSLKQRVEDLEVMQEEDAKEFFLVDNSLGDLDMRVLDLEKRAGARESRVNDIDGRLVTHGRTIRANHRWVVKNIKEIRADIRRLKNGN
jgi:hypothetical protein